jgi:hypothetical protein
MQRWNEKYEASGLLQHSLLLLAAEPLFAHFVLNGPSSWIFLHFHGSLKVVSLISGLKKASHPAW